MPKNVIPTRYRENHTPYLLCIFEISLPRTPSYFVPYKNCSHLLPNSMTLVSSIFQVSARRWHKGRKRPAKPSSYGKSGAESSTPNSNYCASSRAKYFNIATIAITFTRRHDNEPTLTWCIARVSWTTLWWPSRTEDVETCSTDDA